MPPLQIVVCPECNHEFPTRKEKDIQCGNILKNGKICGTRFDL